MRRLLTPAWCARHALAAALVAAFLGLGWWQIRRAAAGNGLSWAYAVEWPVFAGFVVFLWWREARQAVNGDAPDCASRPAPQGMDHPDHPAGPARAVAPPAGFRAPVTIARRTGASASPDSAGHPEPDADLAEYNDYLGWLNANPGVRPTDYSGRPVGDRRSAPTRPSRGSEVPPG